MHPSREKKRKPKNAEAYHRPSSAPPVRQSEWDVLRQRGHTVVLKFMEQGLGGGQLLERLQRYTAHRAARSLIPIEHLATERTRDDRHRGRIAQRHERSHERLDMPRPPEVPSGTRTLVAAAARGHSRFP